MNKKICLLVSLITLLTLPLLANHIEVGTVTLTDQSTVGDQPTHYTHLEFDISWENSWRTSAAPNNWDAAWVFAKWKLHSGTEWAHCTLAETGHTNPTGTPSGVTIDGQSDGMGVFIYRSANGTGTNTWSNAKLRWNYGDDDILDDDVVDVKVFAIEMVYIPEGDFYLGDGSSYGTFYGAVSTPVQITTTGVVVKCEDTIYDDDQLEGNGIFVDGDEGISYTEDSSIDNANYPTGYKPFYCMKYEISQGQYVDFLNTLTSGQDATRYMTDTGYRHGVWGGSAGSRTTTTPNRACNYLSWADGTAYADWAGLRPMTELEFEKVCRGDQNAVANEYAWGTDSPVAITSETGDGTGISTKNPANANVCYDWNLQGPARCGIFATSSSTRAEAGASYYGIMEMSGNLWERPVTLGNSEGRAFTGANGNGAIDASGDADVPHWPGTAASGSGFRGGGWYLDAPNLHVSYRYNAAYTHADRHSNYGFRSARTQ